MASSPVHAQPSAVSARAFSEASMMFCDDYSLLNARAIPEEEEPLFAGVLGTRALSSGINLSTAQMTALSDSRHSAVFSRSLSFVMSLEGRPSEFNPGGSSRKVVLRPGEAALFGFSDEASTEGTYQKGQRAKSVLIQLRPDIIADPELAQFVDTRIRGTEMTSISEHARLNLLNQQLFNSDYLGTVGKLLLESCVLEIVARAIQAAGHPGPEGEGRHLSPDRARMARVRDLMIAEPGGDHTLASLAREAGVSVSGLKVKFRAIYGQTVFGFLHDLRLQVARAGMEFDGWSVTQAAHFVGYRHVSNFSAAFQRHFGHAPSQVAMRSI